jgi:hypothetical protein
VFHRELDGLVIAQAVEESCERSGGFGVEGGVARPERENDGVFLARLFLAFETEQSGDAGDGLHVGAGDSLPDDAGDGSGRAGAKAGDLTVLDVGADFQGD